MQEIINILPEHIKVGVCHVINKNKRSLEEIRLRLLQPVELIFQDKNVWLDEVVFKEQDSMYFLSQLSEHSLYRMEHELQAGYITIRGGHRIGLAGKVILKHKKVVQLQSISYYNIRVAKEITDVAKDLIPYLVNNQSYQNTLLIGPPNSGKTTIIRDLARLISNGNNQLKRKKVAIIDERSEIAACIDGVPQLDVGKSTDVMDACPKETGMMMMIRSMSPDVIILDEIGRTEDVQAINEAILSGVTIVSTIHGFSYADIEKRPSMQALLQANVFTRIIILQPKLKGKTEVNIVNGNGENILVYEFSKC